MKVSTIAAGLAAAVLCVVMTIFAGAPAQAGQEVNIYSYRQPFLTEPVLAAFTAKTGIATNVLFAKEGLIERIAIEGRNSPADILLTRDIGRLSDAVKKGITQAVVSEVFEQSIPSQYRDPQGHWFGLTHRARIVFASKARVAQDTITYEELAEPKWRGRICVRSGHHVYNIPLIAAMIGHHGEAKAEAWLRGLKANLARKPAGNDRAQIKGVYSGECDLAIGNTYYMALMMLNEKVPEQKQWAASVKMLFPNSQDRGVHIIVSGMALTKNAPNKANAVRLMEFLASDEAQAIYAQVNHEYPLRDGVALSDLVKSWGTFKVDSFALEANAGLRATASKLVDKVAFDEGPDS